VVALLGPRQCGKTTLARKLARAVKTTTYFDLENPTDVARLSEPMLALERAKGLVVIDEVQRRPELFPILRVLADRRPAPARFLVLGSAHRSCFNRLQRPLPGECDSSTWVGSRLTKWVYSIGGGFGCEAAFRFPTWRDPETRACAGARISFVLFWSVTWLS
jgi:hypothetical protein